MVKVTIRPWEEVIIHETIYYDLQDLIKLASMGIQPGGLAAPLHWAGGVLFRFSAMPPTDDVIKEQLVSKVHWSAVEWALMPEYKKVILITDINAKIPVIDATSNTILSEVAKSLRGTLPNP